MSTTVQPFASEPHYHDWRARNCEPCARRPSCALLRKLVCGQWRGETVPAALAALAALYGGSITEHGAVALPSDCPQREEWQCTPA